MRLSQRKLLNRPTSRDNTPPCLTPLFTTQTVTAISFNTS